jgi:hypothetical protein
MTLILTHISKHGIIHASDSNLTGPGQQDPECGKKTFDLRSFLNAGLTVAGAYGVGTSSLDTWMDSFIKQQSHIQGLTLKDFGHNLRGALQQQMTASQKVKGSIIYLSGYVEDDGVSHPEFYNVANIHGFNKITGEYYNPSQTFNISEDFWRRDWKKHDLAVKFQSGEYWTYIAGYTSGRVSYVMLQWQLNQFFNTVWYNPDWKFRRPKDLDEMEVIVRLYMNIINTLFLYSDYETQFIGGPTQILNIPAPANAVTHAERR